MSILINRLGVVPYLEAWELQKQLVQQHHEGNGQDTLLVLEHPPVFTLGRRRGAADNVLDPGEAEVIQVERGGDVTWHGPGQIVIYPIIFLPPGQQDILKHLRNLEEAAIRTCSDFQVQAKRDPRNAGVWVSGRKICAVGVAVKRWVTMHGMAFNLEPDLTWFQRINPCGMSADLVTSLQKELPSAPKRDDVVERLLHHLLNLFESPTI